MAGRTDVAAGGVSGIHGALWRQCPTSKASSADGIDGTAKTLRSSDSTAAGSDSRDRAGRIGRQYKYECEALSMGKRGKWAAGRRAEGYVSFSPVV